MEDQLTGRHLSREETDLYKGVGILLIVLHNYFHWVKPSPGENEFGFSRARTVRLVEGLWLQPLESVNLLLDYFGHYGVQIFVFLSAYGLARSYRDVNTGWSTFMVRRVGKIYPAFLLAIVAHLLFVVTLWNPHIAWFMKAYLLKLSGLTAFIPQMQFSLSGPWWFFSFIVQFYALFPLLNLLAQRYGTKALIASSLLGLAVTTVGNTYLVPRGLNLYVTVVGHLPVLCLGIFLARAEALSVNRLAALVAGASFLLALWFKAAWLFAPLSVTVLLLAALPPLVRRLQRWPASLRFVRYCGVVSLPLFAIHGLMRPPFTQAVNAHGDWLISLAGATLFLAASLAAAQAMAWIEAAARKYFAMILPSRA